ncbi:hypothetical protein CC85DRAFT_32608 [Cutaneotrichosporon oleaginosum]|uniref:Uncharacterized protein n=1 Tax=Cutaneotrichosporon oleaginosum TaxID=879819 RepID=A0A0J0XSU2_9TREE|nr:uncharacterized protein CC85DRAFT_32608 [Cutaneotrichosporon oleaginosum]KLT44143.1 hypothetical protein CC85DRAFT_32608 [Cutaneotrichosporon oleaginosum]TXT09402.1 hypothetical protein COLE_03336 [Cutaneotrichosporon oleaginosum]
MVLLFPSTFVDNPFLTRADVALGLKGLLDPLEPHTSRGGGSIDIGSTAAHYDTRAVALEAFARPLWGLASLLAGGDEYSGTKRWVVGLASGTDPHSDEYWGLSRAKDQRMVEMSPLSFAIALVPDAFYNSQTPEAQGNVATFLASCMTRPMPDTNWLWFRVFANLALRSIGSELHQPERMAADLQRLDSFQLSSHPPTGGDLVGSAGWSRDGPEDVKQLDYYSSSFAIQVAQMVYAKLCADTDPERAKAYKLRAQEFVKDFVYYFDDEGNAIPFGRSMVYRFAVVATFSAMALCDVEPPSCLEWGHIKGLVLRHLRTWSGNRDIFRSDGTLNIGYAYDNMYATENYNAPGSPYWACKAFLCLGASLSHPFWTSDELPWPSTMPSIKALPDPGHILVRSGGHVFLLSSGQTAHYTMRNGNAKYSKFSYSSTFGFCYSTGTLDLEQLAADGMLALRDATPGIEASDSDTWRVRRVPLDARIVGRGTDDVHLRSAWRPFPDVYVETWLFPPRDSPNYYVRVHKITTGRALDTAEAGWATYGQGEDGRALVQAFSGETSPGGVEGEGEARATTRGGSVGVVDLKGCGTGVMRRGKLVQSDPNSNAVFARSVLPTLLGHLEPGEHFLATGVFGAPPSEGERWDEEWARRPSVPLHLL